jgi:arabinofuranan 3-O-arabinosyltransferase
MTSADLASKVRRLDARPGFELAGFAMTYAYVAFLALCVVDGYWLIDGGGRIIANDFVNVWAAGRLTLDGHPASAYDWTVHRETEVAAVGFDFDGYYGWHYPPTFLFVAAALAGLPYLAAEVLWLAATLPAYLAAIRAVMGERIGILLGFAFPGVIWNISAGQNGFLTAALIGGIVANLASRPVLSGMCLGLLTYKPQFGLMFPLVLALEGRWRVIAAAAVTAALLVAASLAAFGIESWRAFIEWMPVTTAAVFGDGRAGLNKLQSLFGIVRWLGGSMTAAWVAQGALTAGLAMALFFVNRQRIRGEVKAAALGVATLLATPYLYIYDFPVLAIPLALLVRLGLCDGFLRLELAAIVAACGLVLVFPLVAMPSGFAAAILVAALIARRAAAEIFAARQPALGTAAVG